MKIDNTSCWYDPKLMDDIVNHFTKYPLLEVPLGKILKELIGELPEYLNYIELGCGTGQNAKIIKDYTGIDMPEIINTVAMKCMPNERYIKMDVYDDIGLIKHYDAILMSAFIDVMEYPLEVLKKVLNLAKNYVIIHRQEISKDKKTHCIKNHSHGGFTYHSIINRTDFEVAIKKFEIIKEIGCGIQAWEHGGTSFILKRKKYIKI